MATATARDRMLSNDFLVLSAIYTMNQAHRSCTATALMRETGLSPRAILKSIDRLHDLGMVESVWSSSEDIGGGIFCMFFDLRVTDDAQGLASDIALAISRD